MFPAPAIEDIPIPPDFHGFDPDYCDRELTKDSYHRNLPHWRYAGAAYFTTFRLNDSVPHGVGNIMKEEAAAMLEHVKREKDASGGKLSLTTAHKWAEFQKRHFRKLEAIMDTGHGKCIFRDKVLRDIVTSALLYFENTRCRMSAFVVMPNHVHTLCHPLPGFRIENLAGSWKKHTAAAINSHLRRSGQVWQRETYDRNVRNSDHFRRIVRYIVRNPVSARLRENEATVWLSDEIRKANDSRM